MNHISNRLQFDQQMGIGNFNNLKMTNEPRGHSALQFQENKGKSPLSLSNLDETNQQPSSTSLQTMPQNPIQFQGQYPIIDNPMINMNVASIKDPLNKFEKPFFLKCFLQGVDNTQQYLQDIDTPYNFQNDDSKNFNLSNNSTSKYLGSSSSHKNKYSVVLSSLRWIQKLIIIPSKHGGCHDITSTVMIIDIKFKHIANIIFDNNVICLNYLHC